MSRKSSLLALAAVASIAAFALTSTDALARAGMGMGGGVRGPGSGMHISGGSGPHFTSFRYGRHVPGRIVGIPPILYPPHHHHDWHWSWWRWHRPYWVAPVVATGVAASYAATPSYSRCTCLTKDYTPEGAVVFKDVCTNEFAMNPPETTGPAPQQQSYMQPQAQ